FATAPAENSTAIAAILAKRFMIVLLYIYSFGISQKVDWKLQCKFTLKAFFYHQSSDQKETNKG
ncbi:hypothetical protein, partial [Vibrio campbellii]|uniref:hypothetical protein n=1 Tax=Vibrio campbellii TaxID=680 RepID=UPI001E375356